jgi:hypothetical protein
VTTPSASTIHTARRSARHNQAARRAGPRRSATHNITVLAPWVRAQAINVTRHAAALRPFKREEFGTNAEAPSESHVESANQLIRSLRTRMLTLTQQVSQDARAASDQPGTPQLQRLMVRKEFAHDKVRAIEQVWDFYFELFGQRQSRFGTWLLSCDRISLDCYQAAYMGLGVARSIPAPPPFSYMRTGFSPATFRRGIPLRQLGLQLNPFPLIQLPYHRMVNPWTLGAVLHEVSHNLQNDLGLARDIPRAIIRTLHQTRFPRGVIAIWARWNREIFADLSGLLLGGPAVVASLMDVVGRAPQSVFGYSPTGPHPTPYLRVFLSIELLRRMGFNQEADAYHRAWTRIYANPRSGTIPEALLASAPEAIRQVVNTICYHHYPSLGEKSLAAVIPFGPKEQAMVSEAAVRLAAGNDPGIIPERFMIGAAREALDRRLARPGVITDHFYQELSRR